VVLVLVVVVVACVATSAGHVVLWCVFRKQHENHIETVSVANDSVFEPNDNYDHAAGVRYFVIPVH